MCEIPHSTNGKKQNGPGPKKNVGWPTTETNHLLRHMSVHTRGALFPNQTKNDALQNNTWRVIQRKCWKCSCDDHTSNGQSRPKPKHTWNENTKNKQFIWSCEHPTRCQRIACTIAQIESHMISSRAIQRTWPAIARFHRTWFKHTIHRRRNDLIARDFIARDLITHDVIARDFIAHDFVAHDCIAPETRSICKNDHWHVNATGATMFTNMVCRTPRQCSNICKQDQRKNINNVRTTANHRTPRHKNVLENEHGWPPKRERAHDLTPFIVNKWIAPAVVVGDKTKTKIKTPRKTKCVQNSRTHNTHTHTHTFHFIQFQVHYRRQFVCRE